ncbi:MAG: c-type cytochrome [Pirellulaceae bacterium]|nr:c-type cytochrome [Pirellulaceae bacterium]
MARLHALCVLDGLDQMDVATMLVTLDDTDATVVRHAIRIAEPLLADVGDDATVLLAKLGNRNWSDHHVRLQLAYSLGYSKTLMATRLLARLARDSVGDPFLRAAVVSSLREDNYADFYSSISRHRATAGWYQEPIMQMATRLNDRELLSQMVAELLERIDDPIKDASDFHTLADTLERIGKKDRQLTRKVHTELADFIDRILLLTHSQDAETSYRVDVVRIIGAVGQVKGAVGQLKGAVAQGNHQLLNFVHPSEPPELQIAAAKVLADNETAELVRRYDSLSPVVRSHVLDILISKESTASQLVAAIQAGTIDAGSIGASERQRLTTHVSDKVKSAAAELFTSASSNDDRAALFDRYRNVSSVSGDANAGRLVFEKQCAACHRVKQIGHVVGPDLSALKNRSLPALLTAILDPNEAVEDKYRSYNVLESDGTVTLGMIAEETSVAIKMLMNEGKTKSILRDEIQQLKSTGKSLMPEELHTVISVAQMSDLIAFLNDVGPPPKTFPGNQPRTVVADADAVVRLAASDAALYGDQIVFEPKHKNIGYWSNPNDYVQWTLQVKQPGRYEVFLDYACPDHTAGNRYQFVCGTEDLSGTVPATRNWDDYRTIEIGTVELRQNDSIVVFRSSGELKKNLLDLRSITLRPSR